MSNEKKKKRKAQHSMSDSSEHETESSHREESPTPSPQGKRDKKKKYKAGIPLFSMDDFSDLTSAVPKIEFPSGLKVRHPLFGIEFEERVGLATPKKKKKSMMKGIEDLAAVKQEIFSGSEGEVTPKKKNSRKDLNDVEMVDISRRIKMEAFSPVRSDSDTKVKKKRKKSCVADD